MKHAILGVGAVGGLMAAALASLGEDVTLILRPEKLPSYPEDLVLERPSSGTLSGKAKAAGKLAAPVDVLWLATKTYQMEAALAAVEAVPKMVVPLLNGVDHVAVLRRRFASDCVVPATISVEAVQLGPGRFAHRSPIRLSVAAAGEPVLGEIIRRLEGLGFLCRFVADEPTLLWSKLCFLEPFALVTSASGKDKGEIFADPAWKAKLDSAIAEACQVARASGAEVDVANIQAIFETAPATMRSSMAKDLAAGRQLELDGIAGPVLRGGERYQIAVPVTRELVARIQELVAAQSGTTH
ncbi:MAG TPA: 2-dehydropantoate 2-reductase [Terriglobales bacterium]|nr:2-dehydropantoate 2-reductase [Terriglobales bacterium]